MSFKLTNESATGVLIWWIEGADGSIEKDEEQTVETLLQDLNYSMKEYRENTKMHISGLSNKKVNQLVEEAITWGVEHFDDRRKERTLSLLQVISKCNGVHDEEEKKLNRVKHAFNKG